MALSKVDYNSLNVTAAASKALKWNSGADGFETGDVGGSMTLLSTQTASSDATLDFTSGIDSTYKEYQFHFTDIHPAEDSAMLQFQVDTGTNTSYNQTITSSNFNAVHSEVDDDTTLTYRTARDLAQATGFQSITEGVDNDNDSCATGILHLFEPSSTTFVKHFMSTTQSVINYPETRQTFCAGYINTTTAITRVRFKFNSDNIDSGVIKLYGVT
tara:strand:- start:60 stop:704 length:645 start_codon:yes stop_codon:yes gene_type:complete